jgi:hypothetical protein
VKAPVCGGPWHYVPRHSESLDRVLLHATGASVRLDTIIRAQPGFFGINIKAILHSDLHVHKPFQSL